MLYDNKSISFTTYKDGLKNTFIKFPTKLLNKRELKVIESKKTSNVELPTYVKELEKLNPLEMTPLEALTYLFELQKKVKEGK